MTHKDNKQTNISFCKRDSLSTHHYLVSSHHNVRHQPVIYFWAVSASKVTSALAIAKDHITAGSVDFVGRGGV